MSLTHVMNSFFVIKIVLKKFLLESGMLGKNHGNAWSQKTSPVLQAFKASVRAKAQTLANSHCILYMATSTPDSSRNF